MTTEMMTLANIQTRHEEVVREMTALGDAIKDRKKRVTDLSTANTDKPLSETDLTKHHLLVSLLRDDRDDMANLLRERNGLETHMLSLKEREAREERELLQRSASNKSKALLPPEQVEALREALKSEHTSKHHVGFTSMAFTHEGEDAGGSAVVPQEISTQIIEGLIFRGSVIPFITTYITTRGEQLLIPRITSTATLGSVLASDQTTVTTQELQSFANSVFNVHTITSGRIPIARLTERVVSIDIVNYAISEARRRVGYVIDRLVVRGNAANPAMDGLIGTAANGATAKTRGEITYDEIVSLMQAVPTVYLMGSEGFMGGKTLVGGADRGRFIMHSDLYWDVVRLVDDNGRLLWVPQLAADAPETILGRPVAINDNLDARGAAGNTRAIFGNPARFGLRMLSGMDMHNLVDSATLQTNTRIIQAAAYADTGTLGDLVSDKVPAYVSFKDV